MARSDFLVRMKADTSGYDANVAKAKKQLDSFANANFTTGGLMKQLSSSLVSTAAKFATFGAAVGGAMKVVKDAFFNSEQSLDSWGRTVASTESLYKGFLNALNTGDISGYLNNISQITQAAREAYNAMDELATYNAFNRANMAEARSNYAEAVADFREGKGGKDAVQSASDALIKELQTRQTMEQDAYEAAIKKLAAERGVSAADLRAVMTGTYGNYRELKNVQMTGRRTESYGGGAGGGGMFGYAGGTSEVSFAANEKERLAEALRNINDTELGALQALSETAKTTAVEINNQRKAAARILNGREPGAPSGGGSTVRMTAVKTKTEPAVETLLKDVKDIDSKAYAFGDAATGVTQSMNELEAELKVFKDALANAKTTEEFKKATEGISRTESKIAGQPFALASGTSLAEGQAKAKMEEMGAQWKSTLEDYFKENPIDVYFAQGEQKSGMEVFQQNMDSTQKVVSGLQSVSSGLQQMGIRLPEGVQNVLNGISGAMSVIQGVMSVLQVFQTSTVTAQVTATTANTAMMGALTAALGANTAALSLNSGLELIPFARGGVVHAANGFVPGQAWANDRVPALLNSGELVLNRAQQGNLASQLMNKGDGGTGTPWVSGEQIYLGLSNYMRRKGLGELVGARK